MPRVLLSLAFNTCIFLELLVFIYLVISDFLNFLSRDVRGLLKRLSMVLGSGVLINKDVSISSFNVLADGMRTSSLIFLTDFNS